MMVHRAWATGGAECAMFTRRQESATPLANHDIAFMELSLNYRSSDRAGSVKPTARLPRVPAVRSFCALRAWRGASAVGFLSAIPISLEPYKPGSELAPPRVLQRIPAINEAAATYARNGE